MSEHDAGHRQRLKDRFKAGDPAALTDLSLLELLLTYAIPRADVRPRVQALLDGFGSLEAVLTASPAALVRVKGLGDASATLLMLTSHLARRAACAPAIDDATAELGRMPIQAPVDREAAVEPGPKARVPEPLSLALTRWRAAGRYVAANMLKTGLVPEITLALQTYGRLGDLAATRRYLQDEGLPQRSRASRTTVVQVFRDRLMTWNPPSWVLDDLIRAANETGQHDLLLLLLLHTSRQDVLLYEIVQRLIVPRWREGMTQIGHNEVQAFLDQASPTHPEVATWTRETRSKLAGNILTVLRDYGLLAGKFPKRIVEPVVTDTATRHLARLLCAEGVPENQHWLHPDWALWLLEPERVRGLLKNLPEQKGCRP